MHTTSTTYNWKHRTTIWMAIVALAVTGLASTSTSFAGSSDVNGVKAATKQFYAALNAMFVGETDLMEKVWSHAKDVTYLGPSGDFKIGWSEVSADWKRQAAMKLGGKITPKDMHIVVGKEIAVVQNYGEGKNGKNQPVRVRVTNIFRLENGKWKMISHHTDRVLPFKSTLNPR